MVDAIKFIGAAIGLGIISGGAYYGYVKYVKTGIIKIPGVTPPGTTPPTTEPPGTTPPGTTPPPSGPPACESVPEYASIVMDPVDPEMLQNQNQWRFHTVYKNKSCISQSFAIIMTVVGPVGGNMALQIKDMTLKPDEAAGHEWNFGFDPTVRSIGKDKVSFFVWRSANNPLTLSKTQSITI